MNDVAVQRELDAHNRRLDDHGHAIDALMEFKAQAKGFGAALALFASLPTIVLGFMALAGAFNK